MFVPEASFRLYSLPQKRKKQQQIMTWRTRGQIGRLPFVYTFAMALFIDCALYLKIRAALYSAPSMDFVKRTKQASLSQSQCPTPWPSTTHNPLETPVNHPPQVIRISKPNLHPSPTCVLASLFPLEEHLFTPLFIEGVSALSMRPLWMMKLG